MSGWNKKGGCFTLPTLDAVDCAVALLFAGASYLPTRLVVCTPVHCSWFAATGHLARLVPGFRGNGHVICTTGIPFMSCALSKTVFGLLTVFVNFGGWWEVIIHYPENKVWAGQPHQAVLLFFMECFLPVFERFI